MRPKTIFLDIDGTLLKHHGSLSLCGIMPPVLLDGVHDKLDEWDKKGYRIILITAGNNRKTTKNGWDLLRPTNHASR